MQPSWTVEMVDARLVELMYKRRAGAADPQVLGREIDRLLDLRNVIRKQEGGDK